MQSSINTLVYIVVFGGLFWLVIGRRIMRSLRMKDHAKSGYALPVQWKWLNYPKVGPGEPQVIDLVNAKLLAERKLLPPCVVHYRPRELDPKGNVPDHWLSVEDGNPHNAVPGAPVPHFIQTVNIAGSATWAFKASLLLWRVSPDVALELNQGPRRNRPVKVTAYPSGEPSTLNLEMGVPGGAYAPAAVLPDGEHGSSEWQSADSMAERGNIRR